MRKVSTKLGIHTDPSQSLNVSTCNSFVPDMETVGTLSRFVGIGLPSTFVLVRLGPLIDSSIGNPFIRSVIPFCNQWIDNGVYEWMDE